MELIELNSNLRTSAGKGQSRSLRRDGRLPAVLYGPQVDPTLLSVNLIDFKNAIKKSRSNQLLFNLIFQDGDIKSNKSVMIKELQIDPVSRNYLHVDFFEIAMDRKLTFNIPVVPKGISKGVKKGGIFQLIRRELEVLCLPQEIPQEIEVDVSDLDIGDSIHLQEISLPGNIEFPTDSNFTVITILGPKAAETTSEEAEEAEESIGEEKASDIT
ncbi:MAG: 50S ribosomal protein L25/general stress protein Ctc [Desulfobacterales bacterium]|nr:50S ribosomal protein L25/general stress protein Ctc [Desulfobacterales bacterium]